MDLDYSTMNRQEQERAYQNESMWLLIYGIYNPKSPPPRAMLAQNRILQLEKLLGISLENKI